MSSPDRPTRWVKCVELSYVQKLGPLLSHPTLQPYRGSQEPRGGLRKGHNQQLEASKRDKPTLPVAGPGSSLTEQSKLGLLNLNRENWCPLHPPVAPTLFQAPCWLVSSSLSLLFQIYRKKSNLILVWWHILNPQWLSLAVCKTALTNQNDMTCRLDSGYLLSLCTVSQQQCFQGLNIIWIV